MKKIGKIPTIIGIIVLILGISAGVIGVQSRLFLRLGATGQNTPQNVRITNISVDTFSVTWTTEKTISGFIKYGTKENDLTKTQTEETTSPGFVHEAKIVGLNPETIYFFKINSGEDDYDNNGVNWQTKTKGADSQTAEPTLISGTVLTSTGTPAQNALVYISAGENLYSTLTSANGNWVAPINQVLDETATLLGISVQAGPGGIASAEIYPQSAKPVPSMILGQTYDFKNLPPSQTADVPRANIEVPEEVPAVSGFNLPDASASPSAKTVTLDSIENGETINTTKPELLGSGPAGASLTISVESELLSGTVTVPTSGEWNWEVPQDLEPGNHKVTITWKDAAGITRNLIRNFTVEASEGPAFVATASATPRVSPTASARASGSATPTVRPTATPKLLVTPVPTATVAGTPFPQPESGSLTPTLLLSIMGIGLIMFGFIFWKESNA